MRLTFLPGPLCRWGTLGGWCSVRCGGGGTLLSSSSFAFLLTTNIGPFKVKSTTLTAFLVRHATYHSSGPSLRVGNLGRPVSCQMWRRYASFLLHLCLQSPVNNVDCVFSATCDLPFFRALFAGGAAWVGGVVSDVEQVRFFPGLDCQICVT